MIRARSAASLLGLLLAVLSAAPAAGWDAEDLDAAAAPDDPIGVPVEPSLFELPETGPFAAPPGIYAVTDAYAGDFVAQAGPVTTYGTATVHGPTDSYARVIDSVSTGAGSIFDGAAFNGRSALTDGRPVAGTYYENFFLTDTGYVSFGIVFFQDDAEIARAVGGPVSPPVAVPAPGAPASPYPLPVTPAAPPAPALPGPSSVPGPFGAVAPGIELPASPPVLGPGPERTPSGQGDDLAVEVLRGRRIALWLPGLSAAATWRFVGGEAVVLGPSTGSFSEPFVARWDRLAAPGSSWTLRFEIATTGAPLRTLVVSVTVRSPGLVD